MREIGLRTSAAVSQGLESREAWLLLSVCATVFVVGTDLLSVPALGFRIMPGMGIGTRELGLAIAARSFAACFSAGLSMFFIDRTSRKRMLLGLMIGLVASQGATAIAHGFAFLVATRTAAGAFSGALYTLAFAIAVDGVRPSHRLAAVSVISIAGQLTMALGVPSLLYLSAKLGWNSAFYALFALGAATCALAARAIGALPSREPATFQSTLWNLRKIFSSSRYYFALLLIASSQLSIHVVFPLLSSFLVNNWRIGSGAIVYFYFLGGSVAATVSLSAGKLLSRNDSKKTAILVFLGSIGPMLALAYLGPVSIFVLFSVFSAFLVSCAARNIATHSVAVASASAGVRGTFLGLLNCLQPIAAAFAGFMSGALTHREPSGLISGFPRVIWIASAVCCLVPFIAVGAEKAREMNQDEVDMLFDVCATGIPEPSLPLD